jgi:signal transduction histidine kinase
MAYTKAKFYAVLTGTLLFICALSILVISFVNAVAFTNYPFAGFFFQPNLFVSFTERESWEGMKNGIKPLDRLMAIDGVKMTNGTEALKTIQRSPKGSEVTFSFLDPNSAPKEVNVKLSQFTLHDLAVTFLLPFLIGLFFLVMGFTVFLRNPLKKLAGINFLSSLLITLFYSTTLDANTTYWFYRLFALYPLVGATAIHLILAITASNFLKRHPVTESLPYVVAGVIVAFQQYYLYTESSATLIYMVSPLFLMGCVLMSVIYLVIYYVTTKDVVSRRKTRFYLIAFFFGTIIPVLWSITFAFGKPLMSLDWAIALSILYPILIGYAITREDLFSIESIVRTSLEYIMFTGVVIAAYFVVVTITSMALQRYVASSPLINTILTILIIIVSSPFRKRLQGFIDRNFYPERQNTLEKINEISKALVYVREKATLGAVLGNKIMSSMDVENAGLIYSSKDLKSSIFSTQGRLINVDVSLHALQRIFPVTGRIEYANDIFEAAPPRAMRKEISELKNISPQYFLPIGGEKTRAILVIGAKVNKSTGFIKDDFYFLTSLYPQINIAFINAELHEQKAEHEKLAAIGEVASVLIHEIKNPLGIIKISSSNIRKRVENDPKALEVLGFIEEEVRRMNDTVTNFLNFAKPKQPLKRKYSIEELKAYLENIRPEIERNGHKLFLSYDIDSMTFTVDPDHLKQMLLNLLINAKEVAPTGTQIEVNVKSDYDMLEISVSDHGPGVQEKAGQKLFEPFFTTKEHGTGLGLSVTKQLARANGGDIKWENKSNGGAIFSIQLKLTENSVHELQNINS